MIEPAGYDSSSQHSSPAGLVFTSAQRRDADGSLVIAACVANVGHDDANAIEVVFVVENASAFISSLRAPSAPGEVSGRQARAIIGRLPPTFQTQLEIGVTTREGSDEVDSRVAVPKAYRLTSSDPTLRCVPRGIGATLPEFSKAEFTVGGEPVDVRVATDALRDSGMASPQSAGDSSDLARQPGVTMPASGLVVALVASATFIIGLGIVTIIARRR
jgi:hypothetical protein